MNRHLNAGKILMDDSQLFYIYILECINGSYYTGYTTDLERRYQEHIEGNAKCKFTRSFPPKKIAASWKFHGDLSYALKIERFIKSLTKARKLELINTPSLLNSLFISEE